MKGIRTTSGTTRLATAVLLACAQRGVAADSQPFSLQATQRSSEIARLKSDLRQLELTAQDLKKRIQALDGSKPAAPAPSGEGESKEQLARYQKDMAAWQSQISRLNQELASSQEELRKLAVQLRGLAGKGLPAAQKKDEENTRKQLEEAQRELEKNASSLNGMFAALKANLDRKTPAKLPGVTPPK